MDLDTFLTTAYVTVDEEVVAHLATDQPVHRGCPTALSTSEVLTLVLLAQWDPRRSERAFLRFAVAHLRPWFPRLLSQSAFNRRVRALGGVLSQLGPLLARRLAAVLPAAPAYQALDGVPVPLARRCRGTRSQLFGAAAGIGCGGSDREWYYGVNLLLSSDAAGSITGFVVGPANTGERWLADALLRWRADPQAPAPTAAQVAAVLGKSHRRGGGRTGPTGPLSAPVGAGPPATVPYLADGGFAGAAWQQHWADDYGATVLTKRAVQSGLAPDDAAAAATEHARRRHVIETVNSCLTRFLGLQFPNARTYQGLLARLAAKVAAANLQRLLNFLSHQPRFATFDLLA